ncbi:kinase-like domain-containing protein [Annulohypoxylon moriforme]|nr:kinase-like domain-containing protein [Annulohypoxylon moriforme]
MDQPSSTLASRCVAIGLGISGRVERLPCREKVKKFPHPHLGPYDQDRMRKHIHREAEIYRRLPKGHDRLIHMFEFIVDGDKPTIILEYMPNGDLGEFLSSSTASIPQRLQWVLDAAEAVRLVHDHGVIHSDIRPQNFLVDKEFRLRLIDFSGSAIDGGPPLVLESGPFFLPRSLEGNCSTVLSDLFALGSSIYTIMTGKQPYAELDDDEVELRSTRGEFPLVDKVVCGDVISRCWMCRFDSAQEVYTAVKAEIEDLVKLGRFALSDFDLKE